MIKSLNLNIFGLMILTLLLNYCTPYLNNSSFISLGPDISKPDPGEPTDPTDPTDPDEPDPDPDPDPGEPDPDPDDWVIDGMFDVSTIRSTIYKDLSVYSSVGVYKAAGGSHGATNFTAKDGGSGYSKITFNNVVERNNKGMYMTFKLNTELKDELLIPDDALFNLYVADSNGVIDTRVPSDKTLSYAQVTDGQLKISDLLGINIFSEEYGFSGKEINLILAYSGTNGKKYYIRYPFQFEYID